MPKPIVERDGELLSTEHGGLRYEISEYDPIHRTHYLRVLRGAEVIHLDRLELVSSRARAVACRAFDKSNRSAIDGVLQLLHEEHKRLLPELLEEQEPVILNGEDVEPESVRWLWTGRYPRRKPVILEGDPGLGKSLASLDLSARLSVGAGMPDSTANPFGGTAVATVILSAEDDPADTILPRFIAAGGNPRFLRLLKGVKAADGERFPNLADIVAIRRALVRSSAKLLIVDPLAAYVPAQSDAWRDDAIRRLLLPINELVAELDVGMLLIRHLTKDNRRPAIYRGQASIGLAGAARAVFVFVRDPGDSSGDRRCVATVKFNIGPEPPTLAYTIASELGARAHLRWQKGTVPLTADELLSPATGGSDGVDDSALAEACTVLEQILKPGPVASRDVYREAREAGIAKHTLERAKAKLDVRSVKDGPDQSWRWHMPQKSTSPRGDTQNLGDVGDVGDVGAPNGVSSSPSSPRSPTSGVPGVGDVDFSGAESGSAEPNSALADLIAQARAVNARLDADAESLKPTCSGCGLPESAELGRLTRVGVYLLHPDCRVEPDR
jgi:hypothetical protein